LEEIIRVQKSYSIPDPELRESLRKDNRDYILPFFRSFMRKYEGSHFTKNPEKYVKHRESDVLRFLNNFFDVRA
jgi:exocyst complex protein 7